MTFKDLLLAPQLQQALENANLITPTPIQQKSIPITLEGKDLIGIAQTGTGKTAAFVLPLLHHLIPFLSKSYSPARHPVRGLIVTPTRELAVQVEETVRTLASGTDLRCALIYGGVDIRKQAEVLRGGIDLIVSTPGRLLDHLEQNNISLAQCNYLVLDEADRMLDMGFLPDIETILSRLPKPRQTMLFSATFADAIKKLAASYLNQPEHVEVSPSNSTATTISQSVFEVFAAEKYKVLTALLRDSARLPAIIFTNTKVVATKVFRMLKQDGFEVGVLHGDRSQAEREQTLEDFKGDKLSALVATDVAARGLDIAGLPCVINYDLPFNAEDYVHRIGRTGRAGLEGCAFSLVQPSEQEALKAIEQLVANTIDRRTFTTSTHGKAVVEDDWFYKPYIQGQVPRPTNEAIPKVLRSKKNMNKRVKKLAYLLDPKFISTAAPSSSH